MIRVARARGKHALVVSLDVKNAFNSSWYSKLRQLIAGNGCPEHLGRAISSVLDDRSVESETERGSPQRSSLGPAL